MTARSPRILALVIAVGFFSQASARASSISLDTPVSFKADQSIWGPGSAAGFSKEGSFGPSALGISWEASASSGTVKATFNGVLDAQFENIALGFWTPSFRFAGGDSNLTTDIGVLASVAAYADIPFYGPAELNILDWSKSLDTSKSFTAGAAQINSSGTQNATGVDVGFGLHGGVDLDVRQTVQFTGEAIAGTLVATHQGTGTVRTSPIVISTNGTTVSPQMNLAGYYGEWDVRLEGLTLLNRFSTSFLLDIDPFVYYQIGFSCGDPTTREDDGFLCAAEGYSGWTATDINLRNAGPFALNFAAHPVGFELGRVEVTPEPGTVLLVFTAGIFLFMVRRRSLPLHAFGRASDQPSFLIGDLERQRRRHR